MRTANESAVDLETWGEMKRNILIAVAVVTLGLVAGCAGETDPFIYGSEVMLPEEIEIYREFLLAAEEPELSEGIAAQKALVEARAKEFDVVLASRRNRGSIASRIGQSGSPVGSDFYTGGNFISATPQ